MGAVKECGEISTNKVSESPFNSTILGLIASKTVVESTMVSATATDPTPTATDSSNTATKSINSDYFLWITNHFSKRTTLDSDCIPGFTAVRSATVNRKFNPTTTVLTPILPYPATTYDAILTTMINFQDALKQKGDTYGGLWADEGVYCIAKEIQLMKPDQFNNIFLGLGGFHMEKIVLACLGSYLEPSGIFGVLVEIECYGTDVIKTVISGSHYSRAHTAHSIIHEVLTSMMLEAFFSKYPERRTELEALQVNCQSKELTDEEWNTTKEHINTIQAALQIYFTERASKSQSFDYWYTYVSELFPIVRDLSNSLRCGNWILYLSAIERAASLFFFFGRTNYCQWTPLFLQDCYQLKEKFPLLYDSYMKSQLGNELLKLCPLIDEKGPETYPQTHAIIIDFMSLVRKVPLKKLDPPVKTFNDFAIALTSMVTKAGYNCDEIHIVFDTYREDSIKNAERERRGKLKEMVVLDVISPNQNVPVVLENFWSSSISKLLSRHSMLTGSPPITKVPNH